MIRLFSIIAFLGLIGSTFELEAQDRVAIYGLLSILNGGQEDLSFVVYGEGLEARRIPISKKGRFYFEIPVDRVAFIRCAKPGYLTKRVKIDTHHAFVTKRNAKFNKAVDFDLEMIPQVYNSEMYFKGPVAVLSFNERSGLLKIEYNYKKGKSEEKRDLFVETKK